MSSSLPGAESHPHTYRWYHHAAALVVCLALALWLTWPQALVLGEGIIGGPIGDDSGPIAAADGWQQVWNMWWVREAILNGQNPLYTDLLFWPEGVHFGFQTLTITLSLLTLPVLLLFGPTAAYGVGAVLNLALGGWCTYLLALRASGSYAGALAGGMLLAAAPSHLARLLDGQQHISLHWVALYLLVLLSSTLRPTWRSGLWLALGIALVTYTSWYQALYLTMVTALWLLICMVKWRRLWPLLRPWLVALPATALLVSPLFAGFVTGGSDSVRGEAHFRTLADLYRVDLVDLFLPGANHPLWGATVRAYQMSLHANSASWLAAPGYLLLLLFVAGLVFNWRRSWMWGLLAVWLLLYSLGATLQVGGLDTGIPLPFALLIELPGVTFGHRISTAAVFALVPMAVVAASGVQALSVRLEGWSRLTLFGALLAAGLLETAPPHMQVLRDDTPPVYQSLRAGEGALLVIPPNPGTMAGMSALLRAQMVHQRPIIGGYVARAPEYPFYRDATPFRQLRLLNCRPTDILPDNAATGRSALAYYGVAQIVLHTDYLKPRRLECAREIIEDFLRLSPSLVQGPVVVYDVPTYTPRPFIFLHRGWFDLEQAGERRWRWMSERGKIFFVNPDSQAHTFLVHLELESLNAPRRVTLSYDGRTTGVFEVAAGTTRMYTLPLHAASGQHELRLEAPTEEDPGGGRKMSIAIEDLGITQAR